MDKAIKAFVSHVRAYSKQECSLLLRVKDLPLVDMAITYGLLQLPKMPEFKNIDTSTFPTDLDINTIQYKDKQREAARLAKLEIYEKTGTWPGAKKHQKATIAWSKTKEDKESRKERKTKRKLKKAKQREENLNNQNGKLNKKRKGISDEDYAELAKDVALLKKLKRKKITDADCDREMGID